MLLNPSILTAYFNVVIELILLIAMEIEEVTKKHGRVYRCPDAIENFRIRVRIKEVDGDFEETATLAWQEKRYGPYERDFYKESSNCRSDLERRYHEDVKNSVESEEVVFSYTEEDAYVADDAPTTSSRNLVVIPPSTNENVIYNEPFDFETFLVKSVGRPYVHQRFEIMHIMADFGEYYNDTWLKCEYFLCTIKYDPDRKMMIISPDFTQLKPYELKVHADSSRKFEYWLENASLDGVDKEDLLKEVDILTKLAVHENRLRRCNRSLGDFRLAPKNRLHVHVFLEILTAHGFEHDNIYVRYFVDLPKNWTRLDGDELQGVTPSCRGGHFGFPIELSFEYNLQALQDESYLHSPFVYFEVVSKDTWSRFRSEGLTYKKIPISRPGLHSARLRCLRIGGASPAASMRRFFLGDGGSYEDATWIGLPRSHQGVVLNKCGGETTGTGQLEVRLSVLHQSEAFRREGPDPRETRLMEKLHDSSLIKSVEQVLEAFKRARAAMLEARKRI